MKNFYKKTLAGAIVSLLLISTSFAYDLSTSEKKNGDNVTAKLIMIVNARPENQQEKYKTKIINSLNSLKVKTNGNEKVNALINYVIDNLIEESSTTINNTIALANSNGEIPYSSCTTAGQTYNANTTYLDPVAGTCNTPDKIICTRKGYAQVWSMCNAGTSTSGVSSSSYGGYYQWGNNGDISFSPGSKTQPIACSSVNNSSYNLTANFIYDNQYYHSDSSSHDWCSGTQNSNEWGSSTDQSVAGNATNPSARKGPCAIGYHVPSTSQWQYAYNNGFPNIQTILSLSMAGYRERGRGTMESQGKNGYYWSSSPDNTLAYTLSFTSSSINPADNDYRTDGLSVRCIKD